MSHLYIVPYTLEDPLRPAHQKILEEERAKAYYVVDVFHRLRRITQIRHMGIDGGIFLDSSKARGVVDAMMVEAL